MLLNLLGRSTSTVRITTLCKFNLDHFHALWIRFALLDVATGTPYSYGHVHTICIGSEPGILVYRSWLRRGCPNWVANQRVFRRPTGNEFWLPIRAAYRAPRVIQHPCYASCDLQIIPVSYKFTNTSGICPKVPACRYKSDF